MANSLITVDELTAESQRVLHQTCNFIGTIDRQYEDRFAKEGGKIGSTLRIRKPNEYVVRTGKVLDVQHQAEAYDTLTVATQKGVDMVFDSSELTLTIDRFSERYIQPAIKRLAANIEADALTMYKSVYNQVTPATPTNALDFATVGQANRKLVEGLAPMGDWVLNLNPRQNQDFISDVKSLFHDSEGIKKQYREGKMGRTAGFDVYQNTNMGRHTQGAGNTAYTTSTQTGVIPASSATAISTITVASGSGIVKKGDVFTIGNVFRVHPETKVSTGELQQFTVTADTASGAGDWTITPSIITGGAKQNVTIPTTSATAAITLGTASKNSDLGLAYHPTAFTFVTADLVMPDGVDFKARKVVDNISMRVVRQYDINNDQMPMRIDILYGYLATRPELATRLGSRVDA